MKLVGWRSGWASVEDAFSLLNVRAHSMDEVCAKRAGGMLALWGLMKRQPAKYVRLL